MQRFFDHIFAYYDLPLLIGSNEIIKRLQMWLNNPQCGHKEGQKFPIFGEITIKGAQPSATCILNIALPIRDGCDKF